MKIGSIDTTDLTKNVYVSGNLNAATGSVTLKRFSFNMLAGTRTTAYSSLSKEEVGSVYFDPSILVFGTKADRTVKFRATLETTTGSMGAFIELYDVSGIVAWPPSIVAGSQLSTYSTASVALEVDMTSTFNAITSAGMLEARMWCSPETDERQVICKNARIDVQWV